MLLDKIVSIYNEPRDEDGFSKIVSYLEILDNNKQLPPSRYIKLEREVSLPDTEQAMKNYQESKDQFKKNLDKFNKLFLN